jgi:hypothetical protein
MAFGAAIGVLVSGRRLTLLGVAIAILGAALVGYALELLRDRLRRK